MLGYDPAWQSPKALREGKNPPVSQRIIIPTERSSYIARAVDLNADPKYKAVKEGTSEVFNKKALRGAESVFIVEGEIDALSVIEAGGQALALGGLGNKNKFISLLKENPPIAPVIILSLDNDEAGRKAQYELKAVMESLNIADLEANISGEYKDPNEHLTRSPEAFKGTIRDTANYAVISVLEADREKREKYIKETAVTAKINNFLGQVKANADTPAIPTNFPELDKILDEGLYEGLYILGAISSLGKTSFALQIADQIAQQGQDVLIFSLEMAMTELMAKSISRITYLESDLVSQAKTTRGITAGKRYENYSNAERQLINDSV
jgi:replicative DNA helicase